jgi:hypothetical protein
MSHQKYQQRPRWLRAREGKGLTSKAQELMEAAPERSNTMRAYQRLVENEESRGEPMDSGSRVEVMDSRPEGRLRLAREDGIRAHYARRECRLR